LVASGLGTGVWCASHQRGFFETIPNLAVVVMPERAKPRELAAALRDDDWQAALLWHDGVQADAVKLADVSRRLGPAAGATRGFLKLLTHPLESRVGPLDHRVQHYLGALEEMGVDTRQPTFFAPMPVAMQPELRSILLCPDSDFGPSYEWPLDRWCALADALIASGRRVAVASIASSRGAGMALSAHLGSSVPDHPLILSHDALPLLASHAVVVAADGSAAHLAAYAGATCVTLFGPNDPQWKRPLGTRHHVVRCHVECAPCLLAKCPLDHRCQLELEVGRVLAAVEAAA
jgi:ADP-heptose:LPS heptosyltransferase